MGPECSSAPDDPLWTDQFWSVNSGDQFDTAQAYHEVIEAANKFLEQQIANEAKTASELKAKQEAEAKAALAAKKKTTITCVKGKLTKKVTAIKPVCPKGFKKK